MVKQQLFRRTYKAHTCGCRELTRKAQVRSNCGLLLNKSERVSSSEAGLKTLNNNPDAHLTLAKGDETLC